jgi:hypothetical protein
MYEGEKITVRKNADIGYGFGWFIKEVATGKIVYHTGFHPGNMHIIYRMLDKDLTLIFLSNTETPDFRTMRNKLTDYLDCKRPQKLNSFYSS